MILLAEIALQESESRFQRGALIVSENQKVALK
jgi:hypothetical protein